MMRYLIYESPNERVPVAREIHYINQLMALQQTRMTESMAFRFDIEGDIENHIIAPLLLVPFFENICRHAVLNDALDPVKVTLAIRNDTPYFSCRNKTWQAEKVPVDGTGLRNIKKRLELLYHDKYDFDVRDNGVHFAVFLSAQLK